MRMRLLRHRLFTSRDRYLWKFAFNLVTYLVTFNSSKVTVHPGSFESAADSRASGPSAQRRAQTLVGPEPSTDRRILRSRLLATCPDSNSSRLKAEIQYTFCRISDTRVSRNHGLLENRNGLRLKPSSLDDDPRPLQRGSWHQLHHGDLFSLLPGRLIFRVEAVEEEHTPRNSQNYEDEATRPDVESSPGVEPEQKRASPQPAAQNGGGSNRLSVRPDKPTQQVAGALEAPSAPRRRVLPAWMSAAVSAGSLSSVPSPVKKNKQAAALATPTVTSLPDGAELSDEEEEEEEEPRKRRKMSKDEKHQSETGDPAESSVRFEPKPSRLKVTDKAAGHSASEQEDKEKSRPQVRTPCPYGKDCYRKNPVHFQECSHPGDPDYEEEDRPECPYGTDCYRKNPLHLQQFSHTKKPVRSTRNVTKLPPDEDEEDSGGDDSFINDDSEDVGDDSDFVPPDSDDSEQEDVQSLQKEAKAFLKKRK